MFASTLKKPRTKGVLCLWHCNIFVMAEDGEIKLLYLLFGCCEVLPQNYVKLRSYLNIYLSNVADQCNLKLPKNFRNRNKACVYCYTPWSTHTTSFKLLPSKKSRFFKGGNENNEETAQASELRNTLVLKCKVCSKRSRFSLVKKKPMKEITIEKIIGVTKKKKKKKDKSLALSVNLKKTDVFLPGNVIFKKNKRQENTEEVVPAVRTSLSNLTKGKSNTVIGKNLVLNPFATQLGKFSRKNNKKLQRLKQAVKEEKGSTKKTLKDFLTLI